MSKIRDIWRPIRRRLREPSTWGAISVPLAMFGIITQEQAVIINEVGPAVIEATSGSGIEFNLGVIGAAISALFGVFLPERGDKAE